MSRLHKLHETRAQMRVSRMDGRTRIVGVYRQLEWERPPRGLRRFTRAAVEAMHEQGIRDVELRRGFTRARIPTDWLREALN
jgi:hypothetical protein